MPKEEGQKDKQHNGQKKDRRTNNIMPNEEGQKDKQHNGQKKKDKRTKNIMAKRRTNNDL
jgi:hypothetical protein